MYKLSVIVPVYNCEKYLSDCLASLAEQTVFDVMQVVLIDDGSADKSPEICDAFASDNKNCTVIHKENGGVSSARNAGINAATGEFIGFVDADDIVANDYYENLLRAAETNGCDMAFGGMSLLRGDTVTVSFEGAIKPGTVLRGSEIANVFARNMLTDTQQNSVCLKVIRRSTVVDSGVVFPIGVKIAEDRHFVLNLLKYCNCAVSAGGCGYYYREVETSAMHTIGKTGSASLPDTEETALFTALGLDEQTVLLGKSTHVFDLFVDSMSRTTAPSEQTKKELARAALNDRNLMAAIDPCLDTILTERGKINRLYAHAVKRRSVPLLLLAVFLQDIINR